MNVFIFSAGILCLIYYIVIIIHAGITADFAWIWPAGTVLLWGWCLVRRHMERYELQLPDWITAMLFKRAHLQLDEDDRRHQAIQHILRAQSNDGIEAANAYLKEKNLEQLSI